MRLAALACVAFVLLAGCANNGKSTPSSVDTSGSHTVVATNQTKVPVLGKIAMAVSWKDIGFPGAEPSLGISPKGTLFTNTLKPDATGTGLISTVVRSKDNGATWQETVDPTLAPTSLEPMLWVDPHTGRVLSSQINVACAWLSYSDDEGDTWIPSPVSCGTPGVDHQKIASGPFGGALAPLAGNPVYPDLVSFCYNKIGGTFCALSADGGAHFQAETMVDFNAIQPGIATDRGCGGINGHQVHAADGTIYVPYGYNCGLAFVGVSTDGGVSWTPRRLGMTELEIDPAMTVTPDGTAYYLYRGDDQRPHLLRSKDHFATFDGPFEVAPPQVTGSMMAAITSGSDGRVAVAFLGHTTPYTGTPPTAGNVSADTRWSLYTGMSLDAGSGTPNFTTIPAMGPSDPVQVGPIWEQGGGDPSRNLLSFIDMRTGPDGRWWVSFTDGCTSDKCKSPDATPNDSRDRQVAVAWLLAGPSLYVDKPALKPPY